MNIICLKEQWFPKSFDGREFETKDLENEILQVDSEIEKQRKQTNHGYESRNRKEGRKIIKIYIRHKPKRSTNRLKKRDW